MDDLDNMDDDILDAIHKIGPIIRRTRAEKKLPQVDLARLCKLPQATISYIETGQRIPRICDLIRICRALELRASDVIREIE